MEKENIKAKLLPLHGKMPSRAVRLTRACVGLLVFSILAKEFFGFLVALYVLCFAGVTLAGVSKVARRAKCLLVVVAVLATAKLGFQVCFGVHIGPKVTARVDQLADKCATSSSAAILDALPEPLNGQIEFEGEGDYIMVSKATQTRNLAVRKNDDDDDAGDDKTPDADCRLARLTRTTEGFISVLDAEIKMAKSRGEDDRFAQSVFTATASTLPTGSQKEKCLRVAKLAEKGLWTVYALWVLVQVLQLVFTLFALKAAVAITGVARQSTKCLPFDGAAVTVASCTAA